MSKLIAIDDGHFLTTAGKRTPFFPGTKKFMHENEFNSAVADLLKTNLERCGFKTIMVAPDNYDTPLKVRTDRANKAKADLYISIHANALNGIWGNQQGVSTFHYPGSILSKKAATIIHKHLKQGTEQKDRGVLTANFHVLRETKMPAVLVECAFMDNLREANLLLSDAFRQECADEICKGICEYFAMPYVGAQDSPQGVVEYANGKILTEKEKWLKKAAEDNDTYWLLKKFKMYDERRK